MIGRSGALLAAVLLLAVVAACGSPEGPDGSGAEGALPVVATTTILADLVRQVGGDRVQVTSLVPKGGEVHTFDPTPTDVRRVAAARLVVANGLGLDDWLADLARDAGTAAPVLRLSEDLPGVTYHSGDHEDEPANPHLWLDVRHAARYVDRIQEALAAVDPDGAGAYAAGADAYRARLTELDAEIRERLAALPAANRIVISFHDAFPYFASAYGLEIVGTVVDAPGQDPSAGEIADLVGVVRASGARAILAEAQFSPRLAGTIAGETGVVVVSDLYTDSVGDPPADTYEGVMRADTDRLVAALAGG
jgi:ABC-type Zn uptake system ZnuABC Zn-binding protein ZnuA